MVSCRAVSSAILLVAVLFPTCARAQCEPHWLQGPPSSGLGNFGDTRINASIRWDPDGDGPAPEVVVVGGKFTFASGQPADYIAIAEEDRLVPFGPGFDGEVQSLGIFRGDLIAGGKFTHAGTAVAHGIARWDGTAWQPLGTGIDVGAGLDAVWAIVEHQNDLVAVGHFANAGGSGSSGIARWDGQTWRPATPGGVGTTGTVRAALSQGDNLYVCGFFATVDEVSMRNVGRLTPAGWQPMGSGLAFGSPLPGQALTAYAGGIIVGGEFSSAGGQTASSLARWDGSAWSDIGGVQGFTRVVQCLTVFDGKLIAGGNFTSAGNTPALGVAAWDGFTWAALPGGILPTPTTFSSAVYTLCESRGSLYVGGSILSFDGIGCGDVARWDGSAWHELGDGLPSGFFSLAEYHGDLILGSVRRKGNVVFEGIAAWDGMTWSPLGDGLKGARQVDSMVTWRDRLVAGGWIARGSTTEYIYQWDGQSWSSLSGGTDQRVRALAVFGGELVAAGEFTSAGGTPANRVAAYDGVSWRALGDGLNGIPYVLTVHGADLVAGGAFTGAGGQAASRVAAWDGSTWRPLGSGVNNTVQALASDGTTLYAGGSFTSAGEVATARVARWDGSAWGPMGLGFSGPVLTLLCRDGDVIAGGSFLTAPPATVNGIARWNGSAWTPMGQGAMWVSDLLPWHAELVAAGPFTSAGGFSAPGLARWTWDGHAWIASQPSSSTIEQNEDAMMEVALASGYAATSYHWYHDGVLVVNGPEGASAGGGTVSGAGSPHLVISGAQPSDSGSYMVQIQTECNDVASDPAVLSVRCHADFNADGQVDFFDYLDFAAAFDAEDPAADFDHNGQVDFFDYLDFAAAFDQGC